MFTISFCFFIENKKIKSYLIFLFAVLFHKSMLFYSLFFILYTIFAKFNNKNRIKVTKYLMYGCYLLSFILFLLKFTPFNVIKIISQFDLGEKSVYLQTMTNYGFILYLAIYTICLSIMKLCLKNTNNYSQKELNFIQNVQLIFMISSFSLPLIIINTSFYRLIRNLYILLSMSVAIALNKEYLYFKSKKRIELIFILLIFLLSLQIIDYSNSLNIREDILKNNILMEESY